MRPQTKKLCKADRAADVIGPVDNGERIMAKNGVKRVGNGRLAMSIHREANVNVSGNGILFDVSRTIHISNDTFELLEACHKVRLPAASSRRLRVECRT